MNTIERAGIAALLVVLAACGGETLETSAGPGGGSGGQGSGGQGSGGHGGGSCELVHDEAEGELEIVVTNQRVTPVYYPGANNYCSRTYAITFASHPESTNGAVGCRALPLDCFGGDASELAPGASASFSWSGLLAENVPLPDGCEPIEVGGGPVVCHRALAPAPGDTGKVEAFLRGSCEDLHDYDTCSDAITVEGSFAYGPGASVELIVR